MFKDNENHETQYCKNCLELIKQLEPFKDDYFKNLDTKAIAELAKKSIRLTTENRKLEDALDEIEELTPKFESSTECDYGDFDCENCSSLDEEIVCGYKLKKIIQGIINKAIR